MTQLEGEIAFKMAVAAGVPVRSRTACEDGSCRMVLETAVPVAVVLDGLEIRVFVGRQGGLE